MSETKDIAEHVTTLCAGAVAMTLPAAAGVAPLAVSLVTLAAIGHSLRGSCAKRAGARAVEETLAAMQKAGEFRPEHVQSALTMLKGNQRTVRLAPSDLSAAARTENFDGELAEMLGRHVLEGADVTVRPVLEVAFRTSVAVLRRDDAFHRDLTQTLLIDVARGSGLQLSLLEEINRKLDGLVNLGASLERLDRATRLEMMALGDRFEITAMHALSDAALREALEKKAEEYRAYKAQIEAIDERTAGLGNLKAAARDAADRLDFDEVEALLSRVHEVELDIAAETALLRADNALLRGRVADAFRMLSAAADGFGGVDPVEPARRRFYYGIRLYDHGLRYGGDGLDAAARMWRGSLDDLTEAAHPADWAETQTNLGAALRAQGARVGGAAGAGLLAEAVAAYREALRVQTEAAHPVVWATTQNNLGTALAQGARVGGEAGTGLLAEAVAAYRAALRVWTEAAHPVAWARTQSNLGNALRVQGARVGGEAGAGLQAEAVAAFRAALRVRTEATHPVDWARTQNNLGNALSDMGERVGGEVGAGLLAEAVAAYRAALRVQTEAAHPVVWAGTQNNLGAALQAQGEWIGGAAGGRLLGEAVAAYRAALRVLTEAAHPVEWAMTMENLGLAHEAQAGAGAIADPCAALREAAGCFEAALRVYDPEHMPDYHGTASAALARVRGRLGRDCA